MGKIKSIAFDLEGTVVDLESIHHTGHIMAAKSIGLTLSLKDCINKLPHFIGGPDEEVAKDIAKVALNKRIAADYKDILTKTKNYYNLSLKESGIKPREGFLEFIGVLKNSGIKFTIGSLTEETQARIILEKAGLMKVFEEKDIVLKEHVNKLKPAPDVWIETAKRAGVNPSEQLIFEDSPRGIQGGVEIGAYCIGMPIYNNPKIVKELVYAGAKRIFFNWNEISPLDLIKNINQEKTNHDSE